MNASAEQIPSTKPGAVYRIVKFVRRWVLTLWSLAYVLFAPVDTWFVIPVFVVACSIDIWLTPRALDLRVSITELEREIEVDRPLAEVIEDFPNVRPSWQPFRTLLWLTLGFLTAHVVLLVIMPVNILGWGHLNYGLYFVGASAILAAFFMPHDMSGKAGIRHTFREYINTLLPNYSSLMLIVFLFPKKTRVKVWGLLNLFIALLAWLLSLNAGRMGYGYDFTRDGPSFFGQIMFFAITALGVFFVFGMAFNYWKLKATLSLRKFDPLVGSK